MTRAARIGIAASGTVLSSVGFYTCPTFRDLLGRPGFQIGSIWESALAMALIAIAVWLLICLGLSYIAAIGTGLLFVVSDRLSPTITGPHGSTFITSCSAFAHWPFLLLCAVLAEELDGAARTRAFIASAAGLLLVNFSIPFIMPEKAGLIEVPPLTVGAVVAILGVCLLSWACYRPKRAVTFRFWSKSAFEAAWFGTTLAGLLAIQLANTLVRSVPEGWFWPYFSTVGSLVALVIAFPFPAVERWRLPLLRVEGALVAVLAVGMALGWEPQFWAVSLVTAFVSACFVLAIPTFARAANPLEARAAVAIPGLARPAASLLFIPISMSALNTRPTYGPPPYVLWTFAVFCAVAAFWTWTVRPDIHGR